MAELSSIYVKVHISQPQYEKWLASPMKQMHEFDDWQAMTAHWDESWREDFFTNDFNTIGEFVWECEKDMFSAEDPEWGSRPYINYNASEGIFTYAQLFFDENFINYLVDLSVFRTLADFKDTDDRDFLVIYPFFWDEGYDVIMEIGRGRVDFYNESDLPEEFMLFINDADLCMEKEIALLSDDEDD